MSLTPDKQFLFNYGWDHFWFDTKYIKNFSSKEIIKGPFPTPKLVCSMPFVTRCQKEGTTLKFKEGIPDTWADYLMQKSRFFQKYELMHKEDMNIVPHLRKYRLFIGQGIPDPWTAYPYINNSELFSHLKNLEKHQRSSKNRKERCLCCEREYLFECPDKCASNPYHCSCKDCHDRSSTATDPSGKCRRGEIFPNCLLENPCLNWKTKEDPKGSSAVGIPSPNASHWGSDDEGRNFKERNKFVAFCECFGNQKGCGCSASENSCPGSGDQQSKTIKFDNISERIFKHQSKLYFCPYLKKFYRRKSPESDSGKTFVETRAPVSKEIQTEIQPIKTSKTVQTEKLQTKARVKCTCFDKCFPCSILCNRLSVKTRCPARHSSLNFCCSPSFSHNPTSICPYSYASNFIPNFYKNESAEIKKLPKKKQPKEGESKDGSNVELRLDQREKKPEEDNTAPKNKVKEDLREHEQREARDNLKCYRNVYNCQTPLRVFDHLKYLSDYKLKDYLRQEENSPGISDNKFIHQGLQTGSKFINFCEAHPPLNSLRQDFPPGRFKLSSYQKPRLSELSFCGYLKQNNLTSNLGKCNYCYQTAATLAKDIEDLEGDVPIKESVNKLMIENNEFGACGFVRYHEGPKARGRRRKLFRNRKRRRKLVSSAFGYQDSLTNSPEGTENARKEVQGEETTQDCLQCKKILGQNLTPPDIF